MFLLQGFLNYLQDVFPSLPLKLLKSEIDNGGLEEDIVNRLLDRQIVPDHDMMDTDQGAGTLKKVKVQNPELDKPMDPGQEEYLADFLYSASDHANMLLPPSFNFLQEAFPDLSRPFLKAEAAKIGLDQEKVVDFINWINLQDQSSLPQRVDEESLEKVMRMKPSDFLQEFLPSPDLHFSDETRRVSQEYRDHAHHYLARRYAGRVDLAKVERVLQEKSYLLVPALRRMEQLPETGQSEDREIGPRPRTMDIGFMKELIYVHLEKRIRAITGCLCCGSGDRSVCCVCPGCASKLARTVVSQGQDAVLCPCGEEISLEALRRVVPANLHRELLQARHVREATAAGLETSQCPACHGVVVILDPDDDLLVCHQEECRQKSCKLCRSVDHSPLPCRSTITRIVLYCILSAYHS